MNVTRKQFLKYTLMPGVRPRIQELFLSGFHYIPFFIALVYQMVKLLPPGHPYLNAANIGRYGIRHVIAEAANHLELKRENLDQIAMFVVVLFGLVITLVQVMLLAISLIAHPVLAGVAMPTGFAGFFVTPDPEQDLALMLLDLVFGVPDMFFSCVNESSVCVDANGGDIVDTTGASIFPAIPFPIHDALHEMFRLYSEGLLVVAALISSYFIATVALETAQSGTPFGKRFNKLWAPLRIVVAFGLLIPIGYGLNTSQYIVLYAAKYGSGFATNGWNIFNDSIATTVRDTYLGDSETLVSEPNAPEVGGILQFMYTVSTCMWIEWVKNEKFVKAYVVKDPLAPSPYLLFANVADVAAIGPPSDTSGDPYEYYAPYEDIIDFIDGDSNIVIRFGIPDDTNMYKGTIRPVCGEITIPLSDPRPSGVGPGFAAKGTEVMQRYYVFIIQELFVNTFMGQPVAGYGLPTEAYPAHIARKWFEDRNGYAGGPLPPDDKYRSNLQDFYQSDIRAALRDPGANGIDGVVDSADGAIDEQINTGAWSVDVTLREKGWAGAGLWYNKIAQLNGDITASVAAIPSVSRWPDVMEYIREKKRQQDQNVPMAERFNPKLANNSSVPPRRPEDDKVSAALWEAFSFWQEGGFTTTQHTEPTGNIILDTINAIFGTSGLYSMRANPDVHPLAQLTAVGRGLMESSVRNLGFAAAGSGGAAVFSTFDAFAGATAAAISSFLISVVMITMSAGFVLYYIVPFLPFIYYFFAVGGWLKAIFEAMVGAPLWALAHIRIDGNGLPGAAAVNGYFLIFEIFLRPILIVFGLLASISIFAALVSVLNEIWELVTSNLAGFDVRSEVEGVGPSLGGMFRSALDEFFFTVIYAIIVYMMAMASFKLIDLIPANILRWMGQSVATENDARENAAESLASTSAVGSQQAVSAVGGSLKQIASKSGGGGGGEGG